MDLCHSAVEENRPTKINYAVNVQQREQKTSLTIMIDTIIELNLTKMS